MTPNIPGQETYDRNVAFLKRRFKLFWGQEGTPYGSTDEVAVNVDPWEVLHVLSKKGPKRLSIRMRDRELTEEDIRP